MGQYALLIVLSALILGGIVLFNAQQKAQAADDDLTEYHEDRFARELALVGLKQAERRLAGDPDDWDLYASNPAQAQARYGAGTTTYTKGAFTGTYAVKYDGYTAKTGVTPTTTGTPELAFVTATGVYNGQRYVARAVYEQGETDIGVPPAMRQSIVSNNRLYLNGNIEISGGVHTNNCLDSSGNSFDVYGQGTYTGCDGANDSRFTGGVAEMDSIKIPKVVIPTTFDHQTASPQNASIGAQTVNITTTAISGTLSTGGGGGKGKGGQGGSSSPLATTVTGAGTQADPYVLVVQGNLTFGGNVRFLRGTDGAGNPLQGHIQIYVNGAVTISGNTQIAPVTGTLPDQFSTIAETNTWRETNMPDGGTIGIYATQDITMTGNATVVGHLYTNGTVKYSGGGHRVVIGGITTQNEIEVKGNAQVVYTNPNGSILSPGANYQTPDGIRLAAYREWSTR